MDIDLPKSLTPFRSKRIRSLPPGNTLFFFENNPNSSLYVFRSKLQFKEDYMNIAGDRMQNLGWYVRTYRERSNSLWDSFSEELIRDKLKDKKGNIYEVRCDQAFATSSRSIPNNAYFLNTKNRKGVKEAFVFGANELLKIVNSVEGFPEDQIRKLANFFYEDFTTMKHSNESIKIGQEADPVFFYTKGR